LHFLCRPVFATLARLIQMFWTTSYDFVVHRAWKWAETLLSGAHCPFWTSRKFSSSLKVCAIDFVFLAISLIKKYWIPLLRIFSSPWIGI
jgi:hypothetical protein